MGSRMRFGVAPKVARTLSCMIKDKPKAATIESDAEFTIGRITIRSNAAPSNRPTIGTIKKANQKLSTYWIMLQASTAPTMKKSPWATLITSSNPKMIDKPSAIRATINPQTSPFIANRITRSNTASPIIRATLTWWL